MKDRFIYNSIPDRSHFQFFAFMTVRLHPYVGLVPQHLLQIIHRKMSNPHPGAIKPYSLLNRDFEAILDINGDQTLPSGP